MPDDEDDKLAIPEFIRVMLDPFVNIMDEHRTTRPKKQLELSLVPANFLPTEQQTLAVGKVCMAYSVLERVVAMTIARLALAPEYTTMALTRELTANNQIKVLRILIPLHGERYQAQIANKKLVDELLTLPAKIQALNDRRNTVIHTVWHRINDEALLPMRGRPVNYSKAIKEDSDHLTLTAINGLASEIRQMADHLYLLLQLLPAVDEGQHAQALARSVPSLHDAILPKHRSQPESSEE